jgi:hypothetical protein
MIHAATRLPASRSFAKSIELRARCALTRIGQQAQPPARVNVAGLLRVTVKRTRTLRRAEAADRQDTFRQVHHDTNVYLESRASDS